MRKPWWRSRKTWGCILSAALGFAGPALGAPALAVILPIVSLLTGVAVEGVADAAGALGAAVKAAETEK